MLIGSSTQGLRHEPVIISVFNSTERPTCFISPVGFTTIIFCIAKQPVISMSRTEDV